MIRLSVQKLQKNMKNNIGMEIESLGMVVINIFLEETSVAKKIINDYKLKPGSHVLDIGCGKGFLLSEMLMIIPELKVVGLDISNHAIKNSPTNMKNKLFNHDIRRNLIFQIKNLI